MRLTLLSLSATTLGLLTAGPCAAQGATLLKDIHPSSSSHPGRAVEMAGVLYFLADDGSGRELWRSDGTPGGTYQVVDLLPFGNEIASTPLRMGGHVYFGGVEPGQGNELHRSDGTDEGTELVVQIRAGSIGANPDDFTAASGWIYFTAHGPAPQGVELWRTDGNDTGTALVRDIHPTLGSAPQRLTAAGGMLYFTADNGLNGRELWVADPGTGGAELVADLYPGLVFLDPWPLAELGGGLLFSAFTPAGSALWRTDGTAAGTVSIADIAVRHPGVVLDGALLFAASDADHGLELWKSDGTATGTSRVVDLNPGPADGVRSVHGALGGEVMLFADDGSSGVEVWKSDGTAAGTQLVADIRPTGSSFPRNPAFGFGSRYGYFAADDGVTGYELWRTDGTTAGTTRVADIYSGPQSSTPSVLGLVGSVLFVNAFSPLGRELWIVEAGATTRSVGTGCGEPGRVPTLRADDPVLGAIAGFYGSGTVGGAAGHLLASPVASAVWTPGVPCEILFDPARFFVLAPFATTSGDWSLLLPIPAIPALAGLTLTTQAVLAPTGGTFGFDLTNGVDWTLGL